MASNLKVIEARIVDHVHLQATSSKEVAFGVQVKAIRTELGLSQEAFCQKFGILPANLRNWEQGRSDRPDHTARLLIEMIRVDPERTASIIARTNNNSDAYV